VLGELPRAYLVLAHPGRPLATRDVYAAYRPDHRPLPTAVDLPTTLDGLVAIVENDLAVPAERLEPACAALREELIAAGALTANVSGSGSVIFGIFASEQEAEAASANLIHAKWKVTSTLGIR
jgi:4-diphosphocytidyl-2-C-methyl-D-erythritol kinase